MALTTNLIKMGIKKLLNFTHGLSVRTLSNNILSVGNFSFLLPYKSYKKSAPHKPNYKNQFSGEPLSLFLMRGKRWPQFSISVYQWVIINSTTSLPIPVRFLSRLVHKKERDCYDSNDPVSFLPSSLTLTLALFSPPSAFLSCETAPRSS